MEIDSTKARIGKWILTVLGAILVLMLACGGSIYALRNIHCVFDCAPLRSFEVTDLGVPLDYFPPGSRFALPMSLLRNDQPEIAQIASMGVVWKDYPDAALNVYQFWTEEKSRTFFADIAAKFERTLRRDRRMHFTSETADESLYGCGISEFGGFRCTWVARYDEFVIVFNSDMDDGTMTPEYFNRIIKYVDGEMAQRLETER